MSDEVMQDNMQHTMQDNKNPWNADLTDPMLRLRPKCFDRIIIASSIFKIFIHFQSDFRIPNVRKS